MNRDLIFTLLALSLLAGWVLAFTMAFWVIGWFRQANVPAPLPPHPTAGRP